MFEALDQLPNCSVQWRWNTGLLSPSNDCAVHEIDFGDA